MPEVDKYVIFPVAPNLFHHSPRVPSGLRNDDEKFEEGIEFEQFWEIGMVTFFLFFYIKICLCVEVGRTQPEVGGREEEKNMYFRERKISGV